MNNNINPIAVTISGFIIGKSFNCKTKLFKNFRLFDNPIALIVPNKVATSVAIKAIVIVV